MPHGPKTQMLMLVACGLLVVLNLTILSCCALAGLVAEDVQRAGRGGGRLGKRGEVRGGRMGVGGGGGGGSGWW